VKLHENYHSGYLCPTFPKLVEALSKFGHPIWFYPSTSECHSDDNCIVCNDSATLVLPSFCCINFSIVPELVGQVPLDEKCQNQQVSHGYAGQDQQRKEGDLINRPQPKISSDSNRALTELITLSHLTDEVDPEYVLHASPSARAK